MKKERVFRELLEKYICAVVSPLEKGKAMQQADDIREAWVNKYAKAEDSLNQNLKRYESKI